MASARNLALLLGCLLLTASHAALSQQQAASLSAENLRALLVRMDANMKKNGKLAEQYTSDELWHNQNFDKNGKKTVDESAKYENVFVEGLPYRRKVEQNGKPLAGKAAEEEEKRYEKAVAERRSMSLQQKRGLLHWETHFSLPLCCLTTLFENRAVRHELLNGRDTIVIESVPKPGAISANDSEKGALNWKQTTWIDALDAMPARFEAELLADHGHMLKGMVVQIGFERIVDTPASADKPEMAVWLAHQATSRGPAKVLWTQVSMITTQTWSNYKKFHVDIRLLDDSVQEVPATAAPPK